MDKYQNTRGYKIDKQAPGCLGRMVNLFDVSAGVSSNKLLKDKPHFEGSLSRSLSEGARMLSPLSGTKKRNNKMATPDLRNVYYFKPHPTSMEMLSSDETSTVAESKHGSPNVVAQLMGLAAIPQQQQNHTIERSQSKGYLHNTSSISGEQIILPKRMRPSTYLPQEHSDYKDVYEVQKRSPIREKSPQSRTFIRSETEKEMELVHRKFVELQSKSEKLCEFKDAVEVLSSNKEFLLKFLPETNALIPKENPEFLSPSVAPRTKRITVLRPSKMTDCERFPVLVKKKEKLTEGSADKNPPYVCPDYLSYDGDESETQPTQIVVLKPSLNGTKSSVSLPSASTMTSDGGNILEVENEIGESRHMAKDANYLRHKTPLKDGRDETSVSSAFFNGYGGGDNNSFSRSEFEYAAENFIDFGFISPTTRHSSLDYRFDSPSLSSLSRGSYSPETSVCREAKKHLSERWVTMAADGTSREETNDKSSYTLGEMFALSEPNSLSRNEEDVERFHLDQTDPKASMVKDSGKKTESFSFKGKVSSLFFSRNKKSTEKKSQSMEESQPGVPTKSSDSTTMLTALNQEISMPKPVMCRNSLENQDQPSPVSVLEVFCEEDAMQTPESSGKQLLSSDFHSSSSIGKSPLIESVARTLPWDESRSERAHTSYCSEYHLNAEENEQEWLSFNGANRERRNSEWDSYCSSSMAVERVVKKEVVLGDFWNQELRLETHTMGEEIEGVLLEELVDQTVCDLLLVTLSF